MEYLVISIVLFCVAVFLVIADLYRVKKKEKQIILMAEECDEYDKILKARRRGLDRFAEELQIREAQLEAREDKLKKIEKEKK